MRTFGAWDKNRLFAMAIVAVLAIALFAYLAGPTAIEALVARAYQSDAPLWATLLRHRHLHDLGAYQAKAVALFREGLAIGGTIVLTLLWIMWDNDGAMLSWRVLAWPKLNARTASVVGTGTLMLLASHGYLPLVLPVVIALLTLLAREAWHPFMRFRRLVDALLQPRVAIPAAAILALLTFLVKFPPAQWDELILFDDYPTIYTVTLKGWELLKEGAIFGWDPQLMGGYYTVSDVSHNEIFFMLPFLLFGPRVAFHLMILAFYIAFPFLVAWYAHLHWRQTRTTSAALWLGLLTVFGFFDNLLYWGMVNSFIGLNLLLLSLILFALMREGRPFASFFLIVSLSLTIYAAGGFFAYALLLLGIEFLWHWRWQMVPRMAFVMVATFLITLTYTYAFVRYPSYFIQSDEIYAPVHYTVAEIAAQSVEALPRVLDPHLWLLGKPVRYQGLFIVSLPILAAVGWEEWRRSRTWATAQAGRVALKVILAATVVMLATLVVSPSVDMFVSRIRFVLPLLLALIYAVWLTREPRFHPAPVFVVAALLIATLPSRLMQPLPHVPSLRAYNAPLLNQIEALDSRLILLESIGGYDLATEGEGSTQAQEASLHLESLFPFETSKSYMANNQEGYHHSIYRRNFFTSGAFRGRLLTDWPIEEIKAFLKQWGLQHLVLWSDIAKRYFGSDAAFHLLWTDGTWAIYEYADAQPGDVVAATGRGEIASLGYLNQEVHLTGMHRGELVTLRMNYFPAWRATYQGQPLALREKDGQMAFLAPADGDYTVHMSYPRYAGLSWLALLTLAVSGILCARYKTL